MEDQRKPLATKNGEGNSRLPMFASKLRPPSTVKRPRSPEEKQDNKRRCLDYSEKTVETRARKSSETSKVTSTGNGKTVSNGTFTRQRSETSLNRSTISNTSLRSSNSGSSLRANNVRPKANTAVVKPTTKAASSTNNRPPPARGAQGTVRLATSKTSSANKPPAGNGGGGGKKRPAWDLKGRLEDMEAKLEKQTNNREGLMNQMETQNQRIQSLESMNHQLSGTVSIKENIVSQASEEITDLKRKLRQEEDKRDEVQRGLQREISDMTFLKETLSRQNESLQSDLNARRVEVDGLKASVAQLTSAQAGMGAELENTKLQLQQAVTSNKTKDAEIERLRNLLENRDREIEEQNCQIRSHETERRKLHNQIQELKGNIRVFCRVRPLLGDETLGNDGIISHMNFPDQEQRIIELDKHGDATLNESCLTRKGGNNAQSKYEFGFDKVFSDHTSQQQVFEEISQLVQSALDGYNVCIFAYGQTGSGKTYTMEGTSVNDVDNRGMIPRAVLQIFDSTRELESKGWKYSLDASFLEIYNETIHDLLGDEDLKHDIKMSGQKNSNEVFVTNLTIVPVTKEEMVYQLLQKASKNRSVGETKCNERSSRSHSVFTLKLTGENSITGETSQGTLNLVDLAGSERLKESGSEGQRMKETLAINKSLSNLGNVIMAIGNKDNHIPYRNSKLTYLLQNSLGGNSKTLMFVNVSPKEECFQETLNSLRFATKVNQCNIGTAQQKR
ncbi:KIFC1 [Mytilus coruscus]|uniref:Kinesin-like protein n=1 Tax=Mytilus coruscus TaxID=42192 RepID=A0A6J8AJA6_MYTCO|nr:KIFC1 [Mytilus coruscus]